MKVRVLKTFCDLRLNGGKRIPAMISEETEKGKNYVPNILDVKLDSPETANLTKEAVKSLIKEGFLEEVKSRGRKAQD